MILASSKSARAISTICCCATFSVWMGARVDAGIQIGQHLPGALFLTAPVHEQAASLCQRPAQKHVLSDAERWDMLQFLMDHGNPGRAGIRGLSKRDRLAVNDDLSFAGRQHRRQDIEKRRFPGAVLAKKPMHLTRPDVEADIVECADAGKGLADADK